MFYWVDQVQPYENEGWNYLDELHKFVDGGMQGEAFINSVSGIVNRVSRLMYTLLVLSLRSNAYNTLRSRDVTTPLAAPESLMGDRSVQKTSLRF